MGKYHLDPQKDANDAQAFYFYVIFVNKGTTVKLDKLQEDITEKAQKYKGEQFINFIEQNYGVDVVAYHEVVIGEQKNDLNLSHVMSGKHALAVAVYIDAILIKEVPRGTREARFVFTRDSFDIEVLRGNKEEEDKKKKREGAVLERKKPVVKSK